LAVGNYFLDNDDIQFLFNFFDLEEIAALQERDTLNGDADYVPTDPKDAVDNYRRVLEIVGEIAADYIAPNAETIDREGNRLREDGTVELHPLVRENLRRMQQADLMGFTLPRKYGGLNCPNIIYTMATEIVSRADASFMNFFGLQGIADTVYAFADEQIKDAVLPRFARGEVTGAMVLTEPDAGSDLQAVRLRAWQDDRGNWYLTGVKRFITNGCGEILLVLARSEPDIADGRGLSLFITERNERIRVRHLEEKLGIHGSPTCELVFDDAPAKLIGERQRGLITYVMALMNGARVSVAAQSVGIAEAAYRLARNYAHTRQQFGGPIEKLPPVAQMVVDMRVAIEAARALVYYTSRVCDLENNNQRLLEWVKDLSAEEKQQRRQLARTLRRLNSMLTPMSKYYASEMSCQVASSAIQVLGGSGYMKDYAAERYFRDARITTIYEGTSQLQIVAAVRAVVSGTLESFLGELESHRFQDPALAELQRRLVEAKPRILEAIAYTKRQAPGYMDLVGRQLVDAAIVLICGHLLLAQAEKWDRKRRVAERFLSTQLPAYEMYCQQVLAGDTLPIEAYEEIAGPPLPIS
jgi:alkylation response protein AidB-like acyl-CoA dehydrogenase